MSRSGNRAMTAETRGGSGVRALIADSMTGAGVRALIADSMTEMEKTGTYLSAEVNAVLDKHDSLDPRDKAFYKTVMDGSCERRITIDYILDRYSKTPVHKMKPMIRAILRMSVYQLMWMDSVPDSAVCNEAVKIAGARGFSGLKGYVNGVLRTVSREKNNIRYPSKEDEPVKHLSVVYSCPEWIVKLLFDTYGDIRTESILKALLDSRYISVRMRTDEKGARALEDKWKKAGVSVSPNPHIPYGRLLKDTGAVQKLAGFEEGDFTVQDTGSMMVAELSLIRPGDTVMDLCAAPGGKSLHAADMLCKQGHVYAYDISESRCGRITENIRRMGMEDVITVSVHDSTELIPEMEGKADVVIADVPCSGLGVIGHKSDIRYRITPDDIDSLVSVQRQIIDTAVRYVRPGGRLVYSTCTMNHAENDDQAAYIMVNYGFSDITAKALAESAVNSPKDSIRVPGLQILPDEWCSDGFYICVLERTSDD
ncbi:MAG: 16S rRNA (cytosine(967)-C(5))-methyltransferase RsmB [Lachnospiraceae bacterium]|nr:16S rRNA (cytosine(967)-C(5))-methyltransferase RsmB [Lachnospiraceae bacterium]